MTIGRKIGFSLAGTSVILIVVLAGISALTLTAKVRDDMTEGVKNQVLGAETAMRFFVEQDHQALDAAIFLPEFAQARGQLTTYFQNTVKVTPDSTKYSPVELRISEDFDAIKKAYDHVAQVEFGTIDGGYVISPPLPRDPGYDPRKRPWFDLAMKSGDD